MLTVTRILLLPPRRWMPTPVGTEFASEPENPSPIAGFGRRTGQVLWIWREHQVLLLALLSLTRAYPQELNVN